MLSETKITGIFPTNSWYCTQFFFCVSISISTSLSIPSTVSIVFDEFTFCSVEKIWFYFSTFNIFLVEWLFDVVFSKVELIWYFSYGDWLFELNESFSFSFNICHLFALLGSGLFLDLESLFSKLSNPSKNQLDCL